MSRFLFNHPKVLGKSDIRPAFIFEIQCLSFANINHSGRKKIDKPARCVTLCAQKGAVGEAYQDISDEKRIIDIPSHMNDGTASSRWCVVHNVIMDKGEIVQDFNCGTRIH